MTKRRPTRKKASKNGVSKKKFGKSRSFALVQKAIHGGGESNTWPKRFSGYKDKNKLKGDNNALLGGKKQRSIENTKKLTEVGRLNDIDDSQAEKINVKNKRKKKH